MLSLCSDYYSNIPQSDSFKQLPLYKNTFKKSEINIDSY